MSVVVERALRALADAGIGAGQNTEPRSLEAVLKGRAVELWSDLAGEILFLVADEQDAGRLGQPRGSIYTGAEARMICRITDPAIVREVHIYKRQFNATVADFQQGAGK